MAKNPTRGLSDEDIVRLRDDPAYPGRAQALGSPEVRRALAESRLRALAISLTGKGVAQPDAGVPNDDELLEYLLSDMAEERRRGLESRLRGNPRAFERLVKLHELTSAHVNHRDLQHADMAERNIERYDLGKYEVRMRAGRLAFRRMDESTRRFSEHWGLNVVAREMPEPRAADEEEIDDEDTLDRIERLLSRCSELAARVRQLRDEGGVLDPDDLASLKRVGRLPEAEAELAETIRRLQRLGLTLERDAMMARKSGPQSKGRLGRLRASRDEFSPAPDVKRNVMASRMVFFESEGGRDWQDRVELAAGPWTMSLSAKAGPVTLLEVSIATGGIASHAKWPFLTIVQPGKVFETADLDSSGKAELPLIGRQNTLLLQGAAVWAVHLNYSSSE